MVRSQAPQGAEDRWVKTIPGRGWFVYFRIYGPQQPAFDGSWQVPDFQAVDEGKTRHHNRQR